MLTLVLAGRTYHILVSVNNILSKYKVHQHTMIRYSIFMYTVQHIRKGYRNKSKACFESASLVSCAMYWLKLSLVLCIYHISRRPWRAQ